MDQQFEEPVSVILGTMGYVVATTKQASEMLASRWPVTSSRSQHAAQQALQAVMDGQRNGRSIRKAREAFVAAAAEADILMYERTRRT